MAPWNRKGPGAPFDNEKLGGILKKAGPQKATSSGGDRRFEEAAAKDSFKFDIGCILVEALGVLVFFALAQSRSWHDGTAALWLPGCFGIVVRLLALAGRCTRRIPPHTLGMLCLIVDVLLLTAWHPNVYEHAWWGSGPPELTATRPVGLSHEVMAVLDRSHSTTTTPTPERDAIGGQQLATIASARAAFLEMAQTERTMVQDAWEAVAHHKHDVDVYEAALDQHQRDLKTHREQLKYGLMMVTYSLQILIWYTATFTMLLRHTLVSLSLSAVIYYTGTLGLWTGRPQWSHEQFLEMVLFTFSIVVAIATKARFEATQREVFRLVELKSHEVVQERVLRFQAEFAQERLQDRPRRPGPGQRAGDADEASHHSGATGFTGFTGFTGWTGPSERFIGNRKPKPPPSVSAMSAPAAMRSGPQAGQLGPVRRSGECLPPDAAVWVEGQAMPWPVEKVGTGKRVLCYDNLGRCPRFAEVVSMKIIAGAANWVNVVLADGTALTVTADHPTQPQREEAPSLGTPVPVPACELRPGEDSLMVLKMVPVAVQSVKRTGEGGARRVALSMAQPERHEVFVSPAGGGGARVAVGSADLAIGELGVSPAAEGRGDSGEPTLGLTVRRTFIDVVDKEGEEGPRRTRSCSAPPSLRGLPLAAPPPPVATLGRSAPETRSTTSSGRSGRLRRVWSESDISSTCSPPLSLGSQGGDVEVLVAVAPQDSAIRLSDLMAVRQAGAASLGAMMHAAGECKACLFENRHEHSGTPRCFKGMLCERCHESHPVLPKPKHKSGGARQWRRRTTDTAQVSI